jgi:hypothetical protein
MTPCRREQLIEAARSVAIAVVAWFATVAAIRAAVWAWRTQPGDDRRRFPDETGPEPSQTSARRDVDAPLVLSPELADLSAEALCERQEA